MHLEAALALLCLDIRVLDSGHIGMLRAFIDMLDKLLELILCALDFPFHLWHSVNVALEVVKTYAPIRGISDESSYSQAPSLSHCPSTDSISKTFP